MELVYVEWLAKVFCTLVESSHRCITCYVGEDVGGKYLEISLAM